MNIGVVNLEQKLSLINDHWTPRVVAEMNDYQFKLVKLEGEFIWHKHDDTDEVFYLVDGELTIELRDGNVHLKTGDMYVVSKGVEHRPVAKAECQVLLVEPKGTTNTGNMDGELTAENDVWV